MLKMFHPAPSRDPFTTVQNCTRKHLKSGRSEDNGEEAKRSETEQKLTGPGEGWKQLRGAKTWVLCAQAPQVALMCT